MSVLNFINSGGAATIGGDLPEDQRKEINETLKLFHSKLRHFAKFAEIPASKIELYNATYLFIGWDSEQYHIVFALWPGGNNLQYLDLSSQDAAELDDLCRQVRMNIGDVVWAFSLPASLEGQQLTEFVEDQAIAHVNTCEERLEVAGRVTEDLVPAEIASGLEKFRSDHDGKHVAFIMMQFSKTKPHEDIVRVIQETMDDHGIIAMRADEKQYMDDLLPNVKVYMHGCQFGVAVFERITEDDFNPNVSLEVGYMFGLGKDVLLLKDKTLKTLQTDLIGRLYREFDPLDVESTLPPEIAKWLVDKGWSQ